jgi:hypothetical protein
MTAFQKARRIFIWRGSAVVLLGTTFVMLLSALADHVTQ